MANTYTEWAQEIVSGVGTHGANKLIEALKVEIEKKNKKKEDANNENE